jgi:glycosyltransferase involved in cell wall biosynthesis
MRFVLVSTHIDQMTGYSKVSYNLLKQAASLAPRVKTFHFGFQRQPGGDGRPARKAPEGVVVYDAAANEDPKQEGFGFNKIAEYVDMVQPDVVMIYNDPMIVHRFIDALKYDKEKSSFKLWFYIDQVYTGIAPPLMEAVNKAASRVYCFTSMWANEYSKYPGSLVPQVMEHAVDPNTFTCMSPLARVSLRKNVRLNEDAIVFLNANRNSSRKRLDLTVMAFVEVLSRDPTTPYYLMFLTSLNPQNGAFYDVQRIFMSELERRKMPTDVFGKRMLLIDTTPPNSLSDEQVNEIYNLTDIGINTSDGEGFGLCQLEHLYTGAPQIVTDVGSYRSFLTDDVATFIPSSERMYFPAAMPLGHSAPTFSIKDIADGMIETVKTLPSRRAAIKNYGFKSWSTVCDGWLEDLHA